MSFNRTAMVASCERATSDVDQLRATNARCSERPARVFTRLLHVVQGPHLGQSILIPERGCSLGSGPDADIQLADDALSPAHVRFEIAGDQLRVHDLASRHGTHVAGIRISSPTFASPGQLIQAGRVVLRVSGETSVDGFAGVRDLLTGLNHRLRFEEALRVQFALAKRHCAPLAMIVLELDDALDIRHAHGRHIENAALRVASAALTSAVRGADHVARFGEHRLAVIANCGSGLEAQVLALRLRGAMSDLGVKTASGYLRLSLSLGMAVRTRHRAFGTSQRLLQAAFDALEAGRREGRNFAAAKAEQLAPSRPSWGGYSHTAACRPADVVGSNSSIPKRHAAFAAPGLTALSATLVAPGQRSA